MYCKRKRPNFHSGKFGQISFAMLKAYSGVTGVTSDEPPLYTTS